MTGWPSKSCGVSGRSSDGQRVVGRDDGHQRLAQDDLRGQQRGVERRAREADVELAAADAVDLREGHPLGEQHLHVGQRGGQPAQQRAEDGDRGDGGEAEAYDARGARVDPTGQVPGALHQVEQPVGLVEEGRAGPGELDAAVVALEQLGAHGLLQLLDLARQRGLGHLQPLGRAAEVQLLGDRHEGPHLVEGDHPVRVVHDARRISFHAESGLDGHHRASLVSAVTPHSKEHSMRKHLSLGAVATVAVVALTACGGVQNTAGGGSDSGDYPSGAVEMPVGASAGGSSDLDQPTDLAGPLRRARRLLPGHQPRGRQRCARRRRGGQGRARRLHDLGPERVALRHHPAGRQRGRGHQHRRLRGRPGRLARRLRARRQQGQRLHLGRRPRRRRRRRSPTAPPASAPAPSSPAR